MERLTSAAIEFVLIQPTATGLGKSILDATAAVRNFLREKGLHDYEHQGKGAREHGEVLRASLFDQNRHIESRASLYRPETKNGDPRIWFSGLPRFAGADDMLAIAVHDGTLVVFNLTRTDICDVLENRRPGPLLAVLDDLSRQATFVADELLGKLRAIAARGLVPSVMSVSADTAVGRTLESALGIGINSRREPDYKGIEIKSYRRSQRASRETRKTLFAQVPNWRISRFKSSAEILDRFGYERGDDYKLYCTVSARSPNSQGLYLKIDGSAEILDECSTRAELGAFASWAMVDLRNALAAKHNETFWVGARVLVVGGQDHFEFTDVLHTRKPILTQLDVLIEQGEITMDHLIKRNANGRCSEKGPLFKIRAASLGLLFPPSRTYALK